MIMLLGLMSFDRLFYDSLKISNIAFLVVFNSFLTGVILVCLGLIAVYIGGIKKVVSKRPSYVIDRETVSAANEPD